MKIKVCGLKHPENIKAVAALNPDYMGFICYERSPRFIDELPAGALDGLIPSKTGVFVNEPFGDMVEKILRYDLDVVQLHGAESPRICEALKYKETIVITHGKIVTKGGRVVKKLSSENEERVTLNKDVVVIKAFGIDESFDLGQLEPYVNGVHYFLFDTKTDQHGGSGESFNWDVLQKYNLNVPFFLSGGLSLDNIDQLLQFKHPMFYGVDLNSRFEIEPGLKDIQKLKQAFKILRS